MELVPLFWFLGACKIGLKGRKLTVMLYEVK